MSRRRLAGGPSPWRKRVALVVLVASPLALVVLYKRLERYVEHDPGFCALCHQRRPAFDLWTDNAHRKIRCQSCHHETPRERLKMLLGYVFRGPPKARDTSGTGSGPGSGAGSGSGSGSRTHDPGVVIGACRGCHAKHDDDWPKTARSAGHQAHLSVSAQRKKVTCVSCHVRSAHRLTDPLQSCRDCHTETVHCKDTMQRRHCNSCHVFAAGGASLKPGSQTCVDCHRRNKLTVSTPRPHGAMGQFSCANCHRPHAKRGARRVACKSCHERVATFGLHGNDEHDSCKSCHAAHSWTPTNKRCKGCHDDVTHKKKISAKANCWSCHSFARPPQQPTKPSPSSRPSGDGAASKNK